LDKKNLCRHYLPVLIKKTNFSFFFFLIVPSCLLPALMFVKNHVSFSGACQINGTSLVVFEKIFALQMLEEH
jgi:hypothetical protein